MMEKNTRFEARTSKKLVHIFDDIELAEAWLEKLKKNQPTFAKHITIYKVTTTTVVETQMEAM